MIQAQTEQLEDQVMECHVCKILLNKHYLEVKCNFKGGPPNTGGPFKIYLCPNRECIKIGLHGLALAIERS